jgi:hypothetical protein
MLKRYFLLLFFFVASFSSFSQNLQLSVYSEVSIFTCGPGDALFETFGHNAIRVKDPVLRLDVIYNYGTFDFTEPGFYTSFALGRLEYWVGAARYKSFEASYRYQKRWMKEQILDLTQAEKQAFFDFLHNNAKPENKKYLYDPYFDNCSTKLRDITQEILNEKVEFADNYTQEGLTLRKIMNHELPWNTWGSFGINLSLGNRLDQEMTAAEYTYLPDYLYLAFKDAKKVEGDVSKPLVKEEKVILEFEERPIPVKWYNPFLVFFLLMVLVIYITAMNARKNKRTRWIDFLLFFMTGIFGALIVFLWFFTNHKTAPNNFNFLWAFAPNLIVAFIALKKTLPNWIKAYAKLCLVFLGIVFVLWILQVQLFSFAFLPIFGMLLFRYLFLGGLLPSKK